MKPEVTTCVHDQAEHDSHGMSANQNTTSTIELAESFQPELVIVEAEDVPPNGGYGWVCTICTFLTNANTWGINSV